MPSPHIQFRVRDRLERDLEERINPLQPDAPESQRNTSYAQVAHRDLNRYYRLLEQSLPKFPAKEAEFIAHAMNGGRVDPQLPTTLINNVEEEVHAGEDKRFGVDGGAFIEKLKKLHKFELVAIVDAIERVAVNAGGFYIENMREALVKVGLAEPDAAEELHGLEELLAYSAKHHNFQTIPELVYSLHSGETATVLMDEIERSRVTQWLFQQAENLTQENSFLADEVKSLAEQLSAAMQRERQLDEEELRSYLTDE